MLSLRYLIAIPAIASIFPALSCGTGAGGGDRLKSLLERHERYKNAKALLAKNCPTTREMPDARFFLFGMGHRTKYLYKDGALTQIFGDDTVGSWQVEKEVIMPSEYTVYFGTAGGGKVFIQEDEKGVWLEEDGRRKLLSEGPVTLPEFEGKTYGPLLKVLHQEILVNVLPAGPVPNLFVYGKPWYRDAAMICACLKLTGNLHLVKDWILGLSEPYDLNNGGDKEPDNLGQALYMISLVSDTSHPLVARILADAQTISRDGYISGRTDGGPHPVYQTMWLRYGLGALGLPDPYAPPDTGDSYTKLFWMAYKPAEQDSAGASEPSWNYPYLGWAASHYYGDKAGWIINNLDYPLTWESHASQADYQGMSRISSWCVTEKTCLPHTWHSAEMFLELVEE
ncbi:MAG: hypothetical protein V1794_01945 [Candidatus Glassbacteria bacterium]